MILGREEQDKLKLEFSPKGSNLRACLAVEGRKEKGVDLRTFPPKTLGLHSTKPFERLCAIAGQDVKREVPQEIVTLGRWMRKQTSQERRDILRSSIKPAQPGLLRRLS